MYIVTTTTGQQLTCETFVAMPGEIDIYYQRENQLPDLTISTDIVENIKIIID